MCINIIIITCCKIGGKISEHEYFIRARDVQDTHLGANFEVIKLMPGDSRPLDSKDPYSVLRYTDIAT